MRLIWQRLVGSAWQWMASAAGILIMTLWFSLQWVTRQRDNAEDKAEAKKRRAESAEARLDQRQRADKESQQAKEQGDAKIRETTDRARRGHRDHFE